MAASKITNVLFAVALVAAALPACAYAADPSSDMQVSVVSTSGLNAAEPADQAVLRHEIAVAAHKVCALVTQGDSLTAPGYSDCFAQATADARSQLNSRVAAANTGAMVASISPK